MKAQSYVYTHGGFSTLTSVKMNESIQMERISGYSLSEKRLSYAERLLRLTTVRSLERWMAA
jgi:hypothetical protein